MGKVIITEGIIGAGKTTFSKILSEKLGAEWLREPDEETGNPYLKDFYGDPKRWAFTMQLHLLNMRYRMHQYAQWSSMQGRCVVLDRSYFGDTAFARLQVKNRTMSEEEYKTYTMCYHNMTSSVLFPNICIHLKVDPEIAQERLAHRMRLQTGRECESAIDISYLQNLSNEEQSMVDTLRDSGVHIIEIEYNQNRDIDAVNAKAMDIAKQIQEYEVPDLLLNYHKRSC